MSRGGARTRISRSLSRSLVRAVKLLEPQVLLARLDALARLCLLLGIGQLGIGKPRWRACRIG
jgi:hypothetical protein